MFSGKSRRRSSPWSWLTVKPELVKIYYSELRPTSRQSRRGIKAPSARPREEQVRMVAENIKAKDHDFRGRSVTYKDSWTRWIIRYATTSWNTCPTINLSSTQSAFKHPAFARFFTKIPRSVVQLILRELKTDQAGARPAQRQPRNNDTIFHEHVAGRRGPSEGGNGSSGRPVNEDQ